MKCKCFSVRLASLTDISDKACKARDFCGNEDIIPKSQIYGRDWEVIKSEAYWISAWVLEKKSIMVGKKFAWFDSETKNKIEFH